MRSFIESIFTPASRIRLLVLLMVINAGFFAYVGFKRHDNFHSRRLDLGNMEQTVWNLAHGNGFTLTDPMGTENMSRLGIHADILLVFMVPFYMIWSDPKMLILVQAIVVSLGALPVYLIARDALQRKTAPLFFAVAYLLYPPLQHILLHDFHAVAFSTTFLLFAYWFMQRSRYIWFIVCAVLAGLGKEHIWIVVGLMGAYIAVFHRRYRIGGAVFLAGFAISYLLFWYVIPYYAVGGRHFALGYLSAYGGTENGVVTGLLTSPFKILQTVVLSDRLEYYWRLLLPVAFLPFGAPFALVFALPGFLINTLSSNPLMRQIDYQYTSDIIPFLFISAVYGYRRIVAFLSRVGRPAFARTTVSLFTAVVIAAAGTASYLWGEIPLTREDRFYYFIWPLPETEIMRHIAKTTDPIYTVSATNNIGAHFSGRQFLYNFPVNAETADFAVVRLGDQFAWPSGDAQRDAVEKLLRSRNHELIAQQGSFYAFRRKQ